MSSRLELETATSLTTLINIDSSDRNQLIYQNPSSYTCKLNTPIRNADTIEIMMFQMIRTEGDIHSGNYQLKVKKNNGSEVTCSLEMGESSGGSDLATKLQTALNASSSGFTVTYDAVTNKLKIENAAPFTITVNELQSRLFGFKGTPITGFERGAGICTAINIGGVYTLVGTSGIDLNGEPYVLLNINDYRPYQSTNTPLQNAFLIDPMENTTVGTRFLISNDLKEKKGVYKLDKNQNRIDNLVISITRPDGSLYDFKGTDHQIILRITKRDNHNFTN